MTASLNRANEDAGVLNRLIIGLKGPQRRERDACNTMTNIRAQGVGR